MLKQLIQGSVINNEIRYFKGRITRCPGCKASNTWNIKYDITGPGAAITWPYYTCTCSNCNSQLVRFPLINKMHNLILPKKVSYKLYINGSQEDKKSYNKIITLSEIINQS